MKDTRLYIDDVLVDLDNESIITMNYLLEDSDNPTIVKNSFSKSITLPSTEGNNALFGRIYDLSRETIIDDIKRSGIYFNTLKRTPFKLFIESELIESGYIQLTGIAVTNGAPRYTIQAYGGLGDFLYSLMYDENGDKRNLASLNFGFDGFNGEAEREMDFNITKEYVTSSWSVVGSGRHTLLEAITFVPAYNGINKDFDASKALINYKGLDNLSLPRGVTEDGVNYSSVSGYALAEFKRAMDESEVRDLRSYLQRPALSVRALVRACCNPNNNGGYNVILDKAFFNEENTLYHDAYITLPMLSNEVENEDSTTTLGATADFIGSSQNIFNREIEVGEASFTDVPTNATIKIDIPLSLQVQNNNGGEINGSKLYLSYSKYKRVEEDYGDGIVSNPIVFDSSYHSAIVAQIRVYDTTTRALVAASSELAFCGDEDFDSSWKVYTPIDKVERGVTSVKGKFIRNGNTLEFISVDDNNTFPISLSFVRGATRGVRIFVNLQRVYKGNYKNVSDDASSLFVLERGVDEALQNVVVYDNSIVGDIADGEWTASTANLPSISSNSKVTKEILLGSTQSPADYLLSYCKLFGLRFIKNVHAKTINITSHYFDGDVVDINNRIDRAQGMSITPNVFSKKFMRMALSQPESYFAKKYKEANKLDYAQKRIDTGFSFNTETEEIYKDNVFASAVPCLAVSPFYNTYRNSGGYETFAPLADGMTLKLYNGTIGNYKIIEQELPSRTYVDASKTTPFSANKGYDIMPRMCYFSQNNDGSREPIDIVSNLVVFCGHSNLVNSAGEAVTYYLTDDISMMGNLNDGKACYLLTQSETDIMGNIIAKAYTQLPLFLSIRLINGQVSQSFEFAKSKESYIPSIDYPEGVTLYERYWAGFFNDRMHVDTRKVSCMVDLSGMVINGEALRKFYFFDNNVWLLNKVEDYDPTTDRLTKCEFIKVRNMSAYLTPVDGVDTDGGDSSFDYSFEIKLS